MSERSKYQEGQNVRIQNVREVRMSVRSIISGRSVSMLGRSKCWGGFRCQGGKNVGGVQKDCWG